MSAGGALRSERFSRIAAARAPLPSSRPGNGLRRRGQPQLLAAAIVATRFAMTRPSRSRGRYSRIKVHKDDWP
jgi:hypothetical protein